MGLKNSNFQRWLVRAASIVPVAWKVALRGERGSPSRLANLIHSVLNRLPMSGYPVLPCEGPLRGYRMKVDWRFHRAFVYGTWEPEFVDAVCRNASAGMTAFDLGAQSGFFTLMLSRIVGHSGQVISFEPLPANFRILCENVALNELTNVRCFSDAIAEISGEMAFEFPSHQASMVAGPVLPEDSRGIFQVPGVALDDFVDRENIPVHFIKMDIEGAETAALRGALRTLDKFHPTMAVELHFSGKPVGPHPAVTILRKLGYEITPLNQPGVTGHILARYGPPDRNPRI